jgi:predicted MFS family arabinose efflux permease
LTIAIARTYLPGHRVVPAVATLSVTVAVGAGLGFPLTGVISELVNYHAAFWFVAAMSLGATIAVWRAVPPGARGRQEPLDVPGAVLLGGGLLALLLAVGHGASWGWRSPAVLALCAGAATLLCAWVHVELRTARPLVELHLVANRAVLSANSAAFLMGAAMFGASSLINRLSQTPTSTGYGFGASVVVAGGLLLPLSAGSVVASRAARAVAARLGMRVVLPFGAFVVALTEVALAVEHNHLWKLALAMGWLGVGVGCTFAAMPALIVASVPTGETGSAASLNQVLRVIGGSIGSAASAAILAAHTPKNMTFPTSESFSVAFALAGATSLAAGLLAIVLMPSRRGAARRAPASLRVLMAEEAISAGAGPIIAPGEPGAQQQTN